MADIRLVDTHVHVVSDDEEAYPLDPSASMSAVTGEWYRTHPVPVEKLLQEMDEAGVERAVLVQAVSAYQWDNSYAADSARRFPDRLSSVAAIELAGDDPAGAARAAVVGDGMHGIRWFAVHGPGALDQPRSVWDTAHELGAPVVMTILSDRLEELARTLAVVPPVQVALDHCAFADFSKGVPDDLAELARFPNLSLKVSTITLDLMAEHGDVADGVAELAAVFGADRMMWGSDYSQTHDRSYAELAACARAAAVRLGDERGRRPCRRNRPHTLVVICGTVSSATSRLGGWSMETLTLSDGRTLAYDVYGDPDGTPVIFNHGLSDSRLIRNPDDGLTRSLGVRVIAADQPGVGGSSPQKKRKMVDWGQDMEELADALTLDRFAVAGHSGGSPHALVIPYRMPERVTRIVLASPVAPLDEKGMTKLMVNKDLKLIAKLHHLHHIIKWSSDFEAKKAEKDIPSFVEATAADDASDADTFLRDPAQRAMFEASFTAGLEQGGEGMYEMIMALWDWGFAPEDVTQHVELFYGDADDILDPKMPLHLADRLPDCTTHVWPGAGHYGFVDRDRWSEFFGAVAGG